MELRPFGRTGPSVPVVGVGIGAVLSGRLLGRVVDAAEHLYRERLLHEKYDIPIGEEPPEQVLAEAGR